MNLLNLDLINQLADHLGADVEEIAAEVHATGKDKTRAYRGGIRARIYDRDHGLCFHCGAVVPFHKMQVDHVIPHAKGGRTNETNGVCSCAPCNRRKSAKVW